MSLSNDISEYKRLARTGSAGEQMRALRQLEAWGITMMPNGYFSDEKVPRKKKATLKEKLTNTPPVTDEGGGGT